MWGWGGGGGGGARVVRDWSCSSAHTSSREGIIALYATPNRILLNKICLKHISLSLILCQYDLRNMQCRMSQIYPIKPSSSANGSYFLNIFSNYSSNISNYF